MRVLGIMSGTSIDGIDFAICEITKRKFELIASARANFPRELATRIRKCAEGTSTSHELGQLHHDLGRFYASSTRKSLGNTKFDLIGLHGQTVYHRSDKRSPATLQIGEPAYIAAEFGVPVIANFRANDIAAGGEGAPLAPILHQRLFAKRGKRIGVLNLGGIGNITVLDWTADPIHVTAWDTGPANMLIDLFTQKHFGKSFDRNGSLGSKGLVNKKLLGKMLRHPYFRRKPPKSTGREEFGQPFLNKNIATTHSSPLDNLRTLYQLTITTIRKSIHQPLDQLLVCGGGSQNNFLMHLLTETFTPTPVLTTASQGWNPQHIEPAAFAYLAWLHHHNLPGNIPSVTGAATLVKSGQLTDVLWLHSYSEMLSAY